MRHRFSYLLGLAVVLSAMALAQPAASRAHHDPIHTYFGCDTNAYTPYTSNGIVGGVVNIQCHNARQITLYACLQYFIRWDEYWSDLSCYYQEAIGDNRAAWLNAFPSAYCSWAGLLVLSDIRTRTALRGRSVVHHAQVVERRVQLLGLLAGRSLTPGRRRRVPRAGLAKPLPLLAEAGILSAVGTMSFHILGPLEVLEDGRAVPLPGRRPCALLAILLLHAEQVVPTQSLIRLLWADDEPLSASNALQVHILRLRRALGDGDPKTSARILTRGSGYLLSIRPDQLDAKRFEQLTAEGRNALAGGEAKLAAAKLSDALALWRGQALADFRGLQFAQPEIARLEELRFVSIEARLDANLQLGRHVELVGELEALVTMHPGRERLRGMLMTALYRSGRQADALQAFQDTRRFLVANLGIEPSPRLRWLQKSILLQDPALDSPHAHEGRASVPRVPSNFPAPVTTLVGRRSELNSLTEILRGETRLVTLTGPGGVGKTRLAWEAAALEQSPFQDGVTFVSFASVTDPGRVLAHLAHALGVEESGAGPLSDLGERLSGKRVLLVLDNFEQLLRASSAIEDLLALAPTITVLLTSRAPLHLAHEREFPVPLLSITEAVSLFVERARAVSPRFASADDASGIITAICERLDGLPLAVELAAARVRVLSLEDLLRRLNRRLETLTGGPPDAPPRQQTLRATIDWSYDLLDETERRVLVGVGAFVGAFSTADVEAVVDKPALDVLSALLDSSLIQPDHQDSREPRFRVPSYDSRVFTGTAGEQGRRLGGSAVPRPPRSRIWGASRGTTQRAAANPRAHGVRKSA